MQTIAEDSRVSRQASSRSFRFITITGTVALDDRGPPSSLSFRRAIKSMKRLRGKATINGIKYRLKTKLTESTDRTTADWVYKIGSTNSAKSGLSGFDDPITFNPKSFWSRTDAHELLHTFGVGHSMNATGRISSYYMKSNSCGGINDLRRVKEGDINALLHYRQR